VKVNWAALIPDKRGNWDGDSFSPVVPSASASGEIDSSASRSTAAVTSTATVEITPVIPTVDTGGIRDPQAPEEIPDLASQWGGDTDPSLEDVGNSGIQSRRGATDTASGEIARGPVAQTQTPAPVDEPLPAIVIDRMAIAAPAEAPVATPAEAPVATPAEAPVATPAEAPVVAPGSAEIPTAEPSRVAKRHPSEGAFTDQEAAFFDAGAKLAEPPRVESFEDLDDEFETPKSFWQRFLSRPNQVPKKKRT
jgi:hypothetical protein